MFMFFLAFSSCLSKRILDAEKIQITLEKTQCGSYEIKSQGIVIGYNVKPFHLEVQAKEYSIANFERSIFAEYKHQYDKYFRVYTFTKNSVGDTAMNVIMLKPKKASTLSDWKCIELPVGVYWQRHRKIFNSHKREFIQYNCSKRRLKIEQDPD